MTALQVEAPEGWAIAKLGEVVRPSKERVEPSEVADSPYLSLEHIESGTCRILGHGRASDVKSTKSVFRSGDVLYGKLRPYLNKVCRANFDGVCSTDILVFPSVQNIDNSYLMRLLSTREVVEYANLHSAGIQLPRVSFAALAEMGIPLPPFAEQKRIVAKVEELLARVNTTRERLRRVPAILKRFRQSVLAAACSGRLTSDWRDNNPGHEPASTLLQKIRLARAAASAGRPKVTLSDQNPDSDTEALETSLPEGWTWCRVEEIASVRTGGTPSRKEPSYWGGGVPWISSGEVANCRIGATREAITEAGLENSNAKMYPRGTVLIAMIGEGKTRGQTAILDIDAATNQNVAALVFDSGHVEPEYFWHWALGEYERHRAGGRGGNYPALNGRLVRKFPVPLPPLAEQKEIVRNIKGLFDLADAIESRLTAGTARAEKLTQAVLAKAFQGELVPTEAELARAEGRPYEPAFAILARLHSSRRVESLGVERGRARVRRVPKA